MTDLENEPDHSQHEEEEKEECKEELGEWTEFGDFVKFRAGMGVEEHDQEGRLVTAEFASFVLVSCYTPHSGVG